MVAEVRPDYDTEWAAMKAVAQKLGIGTTETLRKWSGSDSGRKRAWYPVPGTGAPCEARSLEDALAFDKACA
jgi:transposase-like protein